MNYLISLIYLIIFIFLVKFEFDRYRKNIIDFFSIINIVFVVNLIFPAIFIYFLYDYYHQGNFLVYRVMSNANWNDHVLNLLLTCCSWFFIYIGFYSVCKKNKSNNKDIIFIRNKFPLFIGISSIFILILGVYSFLSSFGTISIESLFQSNLFRSGSIEDYDATRASISFQLLTVLLFATTFFSFNYFENKKNIYFCTLIEFLVVIFVMLIYGARRLIITWLLVKIILSLFYYRKINWRFLIFSLFMVSCTLIFGEEFMYVLGMGDNGDYSNINLNVSFLSSIFNICTEMGISVIESLGMIALYQDGYRYGFDTIIFIVSLVPERMIDLDFNLPDRFVRYTTYLLSGDINAADIPPGFIGYMWVNLGIIGVFIQSFIYGLIAGLITLVINPIKKYKIGVYLYVLYAFLYAFLINSGNWEFWFKDYLITLFFVVVLIFWLRYTRR